MKSVLETDYPDFEVLLIDNGSRDGSLELVMDLYSSHPKVKIVPLPRNLGFSEGNNIGFRIARGRYVALLNNDTKVDPSWLRELVQVMGADSRVGVAQSKLIFMHDPRIIEGAGAFVDRCGYGFERSLEEDVGQYNQVEETFYANGAAMMVRRSAVEDIDRNRELFDEAYFIYYEDVDLCWRMKLRGYKTVFVPKSVVFHLRASSSSRIPEASIYHHCKNRIMSLIKNYDLQNLVIYISTLLVLESIRAFLHLVKGHLRYAIPIFRAMVYNLKNLKTTWRRRIEIQYKTRTVDDSHVFMCMRKVNIAHLLENFHKYEKFSKEHAFVVH